MIKYLDHLDMTTVKHNCTCHEGACEDLPVDWLVDDTLSVEVEPPTPMPEAGEWLPVDYDEMWSTDDPVILPA